MESKKNPIFQVRDLQTDAVHFAALVTETLPDLAFGRQGVKLDGDKWYVISPDFQLLNGKVGQSIWVEMYLENVVILPFNTLVLERFEVLGNSGESYGLLADVLGK